jgi:hypothetical protein
VMIESLGAGEGFREFHTSLGIISINRGKRKETEAY